MADFLARFLAPELRAWRGLEPLWEVFWVHGVVASAIVSTIYALAIYSGQIVLQQFLLLFGAGYSAWILTSVWRCADNTSKKFWGLIARLLTVAWAGNVIMILTFLQFELIATYLAL